MFIGPIRVPLVMLHVDRVVIRLGKTARDRLRHSKEAIQNPRPKKGIVNEVVPHAIDVGVHHQRVHKAQNEHHPQRRVWEQKIQPEKICQMKKSRRRGERVPARMSEEARICGRSLNANRFSTHRKLPTFAKINQIGNSPDLGRCADFETTPRPLPVKILSASEHQKPARIGRSVLRIANAGRARITLRRFMFALQPELKIFSGSANRDLAERICKYVGVPLGQATVKSFPDGETYVRIEENIRGHDVFIIQPTCPPTNQHLMELLIMVDAARRASADRITAVIPFFGYARQDRKDQPRVPITAKLVANLLNAAGVHRVLTMDLHAQQVQGFFDIPVDHLYSLPVLIRYLRKRLKGKTTTVVSPDLGGLKMASAYAEALGANLAIVAKERKSATETEALYLIGDVADRDVLMVDDLTETAGTLTSAAELVKKHGARDVFAGVAHAVLVDVAIPRLQKSQIAELITTNSTPVRTVEGFKITVLCVSELLGEGIKRIHNDESVSSLFKIENGTNGNAS